MENKQTAVITLAKAFREWQKEWDRFDKEKTKQPKSFDEFIEPFLEMEKEQIINAFGVGCQVESTRLIGYQDIAEKYYNETYKSE